jgi:dephospho-CoA kinase
MILGIVGKAGSGKSYVSKLLKENFKNSIVIDVDRVGHYVLTLFHVKEKLKDIFGQEIFDKNNEIDRKKLGEIVFSDESKLEKLNEIVHSEIYKEIEKKVKIYLKKYDIIVLDAAMLFKIGLDKMCHKIILVDASEDLRYKRLVKKRNITKEKAKNMTANDNPEEIIEALENLINY